MTVREIYEVAKSLMFEKSTSTTYDKFVIPNMNRVIFEVFNENNTTREFEGKEPLVSIPMVYDFDDYIPFEREYQHILALGLASYFLYDDDLQRYQVFHTDYMNARMLANKVVSYV